MSLGIAFQLVDDVLDYSALQAELGKTVGDDFAEGKVTLPVILAFEPGRARRNGTSGAGSFVPGRTRQAVKISARPSPC